MHTRRRLLAFGLSALSGLLLFAAGEPLALGPLGWVALVPLFLAVLRERAWRWSFGYGLAAGVVYNGLAVAWIFLFGWMAWTALTIVLGLYVAVAALVAGVVRRWPLAPVLVAGAWVGAEMLLDRWPFGGFSWSALGTSQGTVPGVRWLAGVVGAFGISFLCAFVAATIADRMTTGHWAWGSVALVCVAVASFVAADLVLHARPPAGDPVRVGVVQGNVPRPPSFDQRDRILASHLELTRRLEGSPDVIVWPEDAIGIGVSDGALEAAGAAARERGAPMLVGRSSADPQRGVFVNDVDLIDADGVPVDTYRKRHPVPFGEYVPVGFLRRFVTTLDQVPFDLERGTDAEVFEVAGVRIGTPICFESVFSRDVRAFARAGAELIVVSTNNASFERSWASEQHLGHARMRALELRQWVVQAALSGISGVAAPDGTVTHRTGLFEATAFTAEVRARPALSLYARTGDLFASAWAAGTLLALLVYGGIVLTGRRRNAAGEGRDEVEAAVG